MQPMRAASRLAGLVALVAAACTSPSRSIVATTAPVSVESVVEPSQVVPPPPSEPTLPSTSMLSASPSTIARPDVAGPIEVRMLTDEAANGGRGTHEYSQLQAFSPDGAYVLLAESSAGGYVVKRLVDLERLALDTGSWNVPRWHPALAETIVHIDSNDDTVIRLRGTNVVTGRTATVFTFPDRYERVFVPQSFDELSRDGRWMAGAIARDDGAMVLFALDLVRGELTLERSIRDFYATDCELGPRWGEVEPDWIGVSPLGRYAVVQWVRDDTSRCSGLELFDLSTGAFATQVTTTHNHGDLAIARNGSELFVTTALESKVDNNRPALLAYPLPPSVAPAWEIMTLDWGDAEHISCQGPPGRCVVTSGATGGAFDGAVWLVDVDGGTRVLAEHHSSSCGYWVQPRASISVDGRYVVFDSDGAGSQGTSSCQLSGADLGRCDAWLIDLAPPP